MEKYKYLNEFNKKYNINNLNIKECSKNELYLINNIIKTNNIIETNESNILNYIGLYYYYKIENINKARKYYLKAIKLNNSNAMNNYANLLNKEKINYYLKAIELNNSNAMFNYGTLLHESNFLKDAKKYYLKAIELNDSDAMNSYGTILAGEGKIDDAKKYYLMSINLSNNIEALYNYANLLKNENKKEDAKFYFLKAIELNDSDSLKEYLYIESNKLKQYNDLKNIKNQITLKYIEQLENMSDIIAYKNANKKKDNCYICTSENIEVISYKCNNNHYLCNLCYIKINKCPFCRL